MSQPLAHLFSPLRLRGATLRNRIVSTGHDTMMAASGLPSDALIAYQKRRAAGGAGLIVLQAAGIHDTARYTSHVLMATSDDCIPGYRRIAQTCHERGAVVFGQLFHPGREIMEGQDGSLSVAYAPSAIPNERFHVMPRAMSLAMIGSVIAGYGEGARRLRFAGLDGVEIVASHGYLPAQFLNPTTNRRDDDYGGSFENRLRFLREAIGAARDAVDADCVIGVRISGDEKNADGLTEDMSLGVIEALADSIDYISIVAGSSASFSSAVHIAPPMAIPNAYLASLAASVKKRTKVPVIVTGRINQPQEADKIIGSGHADLVGMTRALICDPEMPNKAKAGKFDEIRACIACNQACIGHFHSGYSISCIQHPESGRELIYGELIPANPRKKIMIAGGGPAGMKAAAIAAARGHDVTLYEATDRLGGQALLAQQLPGRAEFGGIVTNLSREMELAGAKLRLRSRVDRALIERESPDAVILATGATPRAADIPGAETGHVANAWQVIRNEANVGASVVIADWRCDWIGMGLAEMLARSGCSVRLCVDGYMPGQRIPQYVRDQWAGVLHKLGVEIHPLSQLYGIDGDTVFFQHATSAEPIVFDGVNTLVASLGHDANRALELELSDWSGEIHMIGDCLTPRTAEEAVLEGLKVAARI